jgi:hypothetical protein
MTNIETARPDGLDPRACLAGIHDYNINRPYQLMELDANGSAQQSGCVTAVSIPG